MRNNFVAFAALAVLILTGLFLLGGDFVNRKWDGNTRFTVVDIDKGMEISSVDPDTKKGIKVVFPGNFEVDTVGGRGSWQIKSMKSLSEKFGSKWAADSISDYLGIGYTAEKNSLKLWDKIVWWNLSRQTDWKTVNIGDTEYVKDQTEADGTVVIKLDMTWERKVGDWFSDNRIASEGIEMTLINTTNVDGLGSHAASVLEHTGIKVAMVESRPDALNECEISGDKEAMNKIGVRWVKELFLCKSLITEEGSGVILRLGQAYRLWWKGQF